MAKKFRLSFTLSICITCSQLLTAFFHAAYGCFVRLREMDLIDHRFIFFLCLAKEEEKTSYPLAIKSKEGPFLILPRVIYSKSLIHGPNCGQEAANSNWGEAQVTCRYYSCLHLHHVRRGKVVSQAGIDGQTHASTLKLHCI